MMRTLLLVTAVVGAMGCNRAQEEAERERAVRAAVARALANKTVAQPEPPPPPPPQEMLYATAKQLVDAYEGNELAGDKVYKGRRVQVVGVVDAVTMTLGTPVVALRGKGFHRVRCEFDKSVTD
jgi:hypothetical protein